MLKQQVRALQAKNTAVKNAAAVQAGKVKEEGDGVVKREKDGSPRRIKKEERD